MNNVSYHLHIQVFGIKGPSWLCCIPEYNFIKGMSIDYMHCVLLGICRLLLRLWMQSTYHQEVWYIGNQMNIVDSRLCNIKPPNEIQRTPRSIELTMKFWKGMTNYKGIHIAGKVCELRISYLAI